jgi:DNA uptake protein ComE-like DNA-binding protein
LVEVFGLSDSLVSGIKNRVYVDTSSIVKLDVNKAGEFEMARHPYIGKYNARGIIKYRDSTGKINNIIELKINGLVSDEVFEKLKKYLAV